MSDTKIITPTTNESSKPTTTPCTSTTANANANANPIRGLNVSGRSWKLHSSQCQKASNLKTKVKGSAFSSSWEKKMAEKQRRKEMLELQNEMKEEKRQAKLQKNERRLEQERRRMENEYKNATKGSKTLNTNTAGLKMKAMNKKQLRQIKKTRMNTRTGVIEYVSPYAK